MRITLNELRNLVKNILKENIQFPNKQEGESIGDMFKTFRQDAIAYLKDNIKAFNADTQDFEPIKSIEYSAGYYENGIPELMMLNLKNQKNGELNMNLYINTWATSRSNKDANVAAFIGNSGKLIFESMETVNILAEFISNSFSTFQKKNLSKQEIISSILPYVEIKKSKENPDYIKGATGAMGSSEFRRGGGRNQGKLGGDYKSKFGNEPAEEPVTSSEEKTYANYNEWIGNESAENQKAISVLYRMVEKGRMEEDEFNSEIQELLNPPLNEIRKLIKNVLKETKKNKFKR